jgi:hypothetical protein
MRSWVRECIFFLSLDGRDTLPTWDEVVTEVSGFAPCTRAKAESRVWEALRQDQAVGVLDDDLELRLDLGPASDQDPSWLTDRLARGRR